MRREKGNWYVVRNCCTSGNCATCHGVTPFGKPIQVVQCGNVSKAYAEWIADNWKTYKAVATEAEEQRA